MFKSFKKEPSPDKVKEIIQATLSALNEGNEELALETVRPLVNAAGRHKNSAFALLELIDDRHLNPEQALEILTNIYGAHSDDDKIVCEIGCVMEAARDIDDLNAPPPENLLFGKVIKRLSEISLRDRGKSNEAAVIEALSSTARLAGRQYDSLALRSYARLVELLPEASWAHYNQGLYFKTRGFFKQGIAANKKAIELSETPNESHQWNLGICATGAGDGKQALQVWKDRGQKIEMGRFDLPEGGYPSCKVKLAAFPLAERATDNDTPGLEETIWIERLSPCHGIIRSVLYYDLGVDYGDVILFDGAPITYHKYGDDDIAVFPHLATLLKRNYQFYDFAGTQAKGGALNSVSKSLDDDAVVYSHTENFHILCSTCWNNQDRQHQHISDEEKHVVTGRIAAPSDMEPGSLLNQIDAALKDVPENRIFSPSLCQAAGQSDRAKIEERRFNILWPNYGE